MRLVARGRSYVIASLLAALALVAGLAAVSGAAAQAAPGFSPTFRVDGRVQHPKTYDLGALEALPAHDVTVTFLGPTGPQTHHYRGALLFDVATAAAPRFDANRKNDKLRWTARVNATDGYEATVAWGEYDPGYENKQVLLAYEDGGALLSADGMARLVVPGDSHGGRYVSNVNAVALDPPRDAAGPFGFPWH